MRIEAYDCKHKIADKWEGNPCGILVNDGMPVYKVKRKDEQGKCIMLQRNLLLPIESKFQQHQRNQPNHLEEKTQKIGQ